MSDQPDPDKKLVGIRMPRETWKRLQILSQGAKKSANVVAADILTSATDHITLSPEDYEEIARDTRAAIEKNKKR